jgi:predicted secreted protein
VTLVAHCLLNPTTKVHGLVRQTGRSPALREMLDGETALIQLPCPEATYLGMQRWGMTYEQYDTRAFRRHCAEILRPILDTLSALKAGGVTLSEVIGVDGSPNCGVALTCQGYSGGEPEDVYGAGGTPQHARTVEGSGVFFEVLAQMLSEAGIEARFIAVPEDSL